MHVIATAGHVDHGKSTLIHRLTGTQPDRWAEERRRGLTIDLGFAWTRLPSGEVAAFVDVPGHERFVGNMLAGVGPVPAVLFVVAADEGWRPQSEEHLTALDALSVEHGVLVVTRTDLADPEPAREQALDRLAGTSLGRGGPVPSVAVSGLTGDGMDSLVAQLEAMLARLPDPDREADVRLWIDRSFTISGAGTVVTGTLRAGRLRVGDELLPYTATANDAGPRPRVRGLQALGADLDEVRAPARVAVNLRGLSYDALRRGDALLTPDAWVGTDLVDVRLRRLYRSPHPIQDRTGGTEPEQLVRSTGTLMLHLGSAAVAVRPRPLDAQGDLVRLRLARDLPLRVGDRGLLRDPGQHRVLAGVEVLDVIPPALDRRGSARARARELADAFDDGLPRPDALAAVLLRRHGLVAADRLRMVGLPTVGRLVETGSGRTWCVDQTYWHQLLRRVPEELAGWREQNPLTAGMPGKALRQRLELPAELLEPLLAEADLRVRDGYVLDGRRTSLPAAVDRAVRAVEQDLAESPFEAPTADRLRTLGLGGRELAAAVRAGRLVRIADGLVLLPGAEWQAVSRLAELPQPFTLSLARQALGTTRRVAVPLLELLHDRGVTERLSDGTHRVRRRP